MSDDSGRTDTMRIRLSEVMRPAPLVSPERRRPTPDTAKTEAPAEAGLRQFRDLLECAYDAVLIADLQGAIQQFNSRAVEFFLYERQELTGRPVLTLISGAADNTLELIQKTLHQERRVFIEAYCLRADGSPFPCEITVSRIPLGTQEHFCFFIRNVTVRKQTEEALAQAQRKLLEAAHQAGMAQLATGVLHDVGNLLNSVNVSTELLDATLSRSALAAAGRLRELMVGQGDKLNEFMREDPRGRKLPDLLLKLLETLEKERQTLQEEVARLRERLAMIQEVVSAQQNYARAGLLAEEVNLNDLVQDALAIVSNTFKNHDLKVISELHPVPLLPLQRSKMGHVLINLFYNARDALLPIHDRPRQVRIESGVRDGTLVLAVSDNGTGIAPEHLDRIFQHGFTTKPEGHGFGLHSSANFIAEMGGEISVTSAGSNQGASFIIRFPVGGSTP